MGTIRQGLAQSGRIRGGFLVLGRNDDHDPVRGIELLGPAGLGHGQHRNPHPGLNGVPLGGRREPGGDPCPRHRAYLDDGFHDRDDRPDAPSARYETFVGEHGQGALRGVSGHCVVAGQLWLARHPVTGGELSGADPLPQ